MLLRDYGHVFYKKKNKTRIFFLFISWSRHTANNALIGIQFAKNTYIKWFPMTRLGPSLFSFKRRFPVWLAYDHPHHRLCEDYIKLQCLLWEPCLLSVEHLISEQSFLVSVAIFLRVSTQILISTAYCKCMFHCGWLTFCNSDSTQKGHLVNRYGS